MTREEAKTVFLNRGYVEVEGGTIYDADKWREACRVISEWLEQEPTITSTEDSAEMTYPQVEGITPTVVEPLPNVEKEVEKYKKMLKHPVIKSIMGMDETQESCDVPDINDGDIISKQTVLDTISELNAISFYEAQEDSKECYYSIRQAIKDLPSVKPQERTGHWEWVQYDYNPKIGNWHCTECRCIVVECVDKNEKGGIPLYKYCPQCGAKMEVEQNG